MTLARQVLHVAWKDVRRARWTLLAFSGLCAWAIRPAIDPLDMMELTWQMIIVLAAWVTVGILIQADSPTGATAQWRTLPVDPLAITLAKGATILGVVLLPALAAQIIVLLAYDVGVQWMPYILGSGALSLGVFLTAAVIVASLTRDLPGFVVASVLLYAVPLMVLSMLDRGPSGGITRAFETASAIPIPLSIAAAFLLVSQVYRRGDRKVGVLLAIPVLIAIFGGWVATLGERVPAARNAADLPVALRADLILEHFALVEDVLEARIRIEGGSDRHGYSFHATDVRIHARDGQVVRTAARSGIWLRDPLPLPEGVRWVPPRDLPDSRIRLRLSSAERESLAGGIEWIALHGTVTVVEPRAVLSMPAKVGSAGKGAGRRARIVSVTNGSRDVELDLGSKWMPARNHRAFRQSDLARVRNVEMEHRPADGILIDEARREAVPLQASRGSRLDSGGSMLPGFKVSRELLSMYVAPYEGQPERTSRDLDRLRFLAVDWTFVGTHRTSVDARTSGVSGRDR